MKAKFNPNIGISIALLVLLAGCQAFNGISMAAPTPAAPFPLTGARASAVGAAALMYYQNPTHSGTLLAPIDADTGLPAAGFSPIDFGTNIQFAFSADRETLAFISTRTASCQDQCLHLLDLRAWKETIQPIRLAGDSTQGVILALNPQGTLVGAAFNNPSQAGSQLLLIDPAQGKVIQQASLSANVQQMGFTPAGSLAVYGNVPQVGGQESKMYVALYDSASLQATWRQDLDEISFGSDFATGNIDPVKSIFLSPAAVFAPDYSRLYVVAADKPLLVSVDFAAKSVQSANIHSRQGWLEQLLTGGSGVAYAKALNGASKLGALSPDGKYLYVVGQSYKAVKGQDGNLTSETTPLGLQVVNLGDGTEVGTLPSTAYNVSVSLDGKMILLTGYDAEKNGTSQPWTDLVDASTLKVTRRIDSELYPSRLLNGSLVLVGWVWSETGSNHMVVYDPGSLTLRSQRQGSSQEYATWVPIP